MKSLRGENKCSLIKEGVFSQLFLMLCRIFVGNKIYISYESCNYKTELLQKVSRLKSTTEIALFANVRCVRNFNRPFARSGHMVRNKLCWDTSYTVGLSKQRAIGLDFVLKVPPLCNFRPSIIHSVPCDRIVQRSY